MSNLTIGKYSNQDRKLHEKMERLGLSEYKIEKIIRVANENNANLQKAYRMTYAQIFNAYVVLIPVLTFFIGSIALEDPGALPVALLAFGLPIVVLEIVCRFHKGFWKMIRIYCGLKGL